VLLDWQSRDVQRLSRLCLLDAEPIILQFAADERGNPDQHGNENRERERDQDACPGRQDIGGWTIRVQVRAVEAHRDRKREGEQSLDPTTSRQLAPPSIVHVVRDRPSGDVHECGHRERSATFDEYLTAEQRKRGSHVDETHHNSCHTDPSEAPQLAFDRV